MRRSIGAGPSILGTQTATTRVNTNERQFVFVAQTADYTGARPRCHWRDRGFQWRRSPALARDPTDELATARRRGIQPERRRRPLHPSHGADCLRGSQRVDASPFRAARPRTPARPDRHARPARVQVGELVQARSRPRSRRHLAPNGRSRGLWFDREMLRSAAGPRGCSPRWSASSTRNRPAGGACQRLLYPRGVTCSGDLSVGHRFCVRAIYPRGRNPGSGASTSPTTRTPRPARPRGIGNRFDPSSAARLAAASPCDRGAPVTVPG
jgi:hypothetical protein